MCCRLAAKASSRIIVLTEEAVLTLTLLDHTCAAMLSTYVWMCAKGAILGSASAELLVLGRLLSHIL